MNHLIKREAYRMNRSGREFFVLKYLQNNIPVNLRILESKGDLIEEIYPADANKEDSELIMGGVNDVSNLTPLTKETEEKLDGILGAYQELAKLILTQGISQQEDNRTLKHVGEVAGSAYAVLHQTGSFFVEILALHIKGAGEQPELYLINQQFAELAFLDYLKEHPQGEKKAYARLNDIFYLGVMPSGVKGKRYYTIGVIEFLIEQLACNKAYMLEKATNGFEPLHVKKFDAKLDKALKKNVKEVCDTFLEKMEKEAKK